MRPEEYALIVARRWWLPLAAMLAAAVVAFVYTSAQPTTYQTSSSIMAVAEPPDYWLDLYAKNRLAAYKTLISNWDFVAGVIQRANLNVDVQQAMESLSVGNTPDSNTIHVIVTESDPVRAAALANALADTFVAQANAESERTQASYRAGPDEQPRGTVRVLKLTTPGPPTTPTGPRVKLNTAAAALLGLVFGVLLTFAAEYLDDTLRGARDVDRYLELPTIAGIPRTSAAGDHT